MRRLILLISLDFFLFSPIQEFSEEPKDFNFSVAVEEQDSEVRTTRPDVV